MGIFLNVFRARLKGMVLLGLISTTLFSAATPQTQGNEKTAVTNKSSSSVLPYRYRTRQLPRRAQQYYALVWGVDSLVVKSVESGEIVKFTYRVVDASKAEMLNDKKNEPSLIDLRSGVKLVVPSLEKVGQLRQSGKPEVGKVYWMAFSNKGRLVRPGHHVDVVIGQFKADGLIVQ
jgi:hypothetical protein